ncbi:MAG: hypothetical protein EB078_11650 [Proteobacteria bacterium]|nr:hypothetical protein [Pseudomonadota bacterium]
MPITRPERVMKMQGGTMKRKRLGFDKHFRLTRLKKLFLNSSRKSVHYWMLCHLQSQPGQTQPMNFPAKYPIIKPVLFVGMTII